MNENGLNRKGSLDFHIRSNERLIPLQNLDFEKYIFCPTRQIQLG